MRAVWPRERVMLSPLVIVRSKVHFDAVIQPAPHKDEPGALVEMLKRNDFNRKTIPARCSSFASEPPSAAIRNLMRVAGGSF